MPRDHSLLIKIYSQQNKKCFVYTTSSLKGEGLKKRSNNRLAKNALAFRTIWIFRNVNWDNDTKEYSKQNIKRMLIPYTIQQPTNAMLGFRQLYMSYYGKSCLICHNVIRTVIHALNNCRKEIQELTLTSLKL